MRKKIIVPYILYSLAILSSPSLSAQEGAEPSMDRDQKNAISILLGLHFSKSQDQVYSPMIYNGSGLGAINLRYERFGSGGIHQLNLEFDAIEVSSTALISYNIFGTIETRVASQATQLNASYGYATQIKSTENVDLYLGGVIEGKVHVTEYNFASSSDEGYFIANSLHVWLRGIRQLSAKNSVKVEARSPLLSIVSRSKYAIVDNNSIQFDGSDLAYFYRSNELASIGDYRGIQADFTYSRQFTPVTYLNLRYRFDYMRFKKPVPISVLKNNFDIGLTFKF